MPALFLHVSQCALFCPTEDAGFCHSLQIKALNILSNMTTNKHYYFYFLVPSELWTKLFYLVFSVSLCSLAAHLIVIFPPLGLM